MANPKDNTNPFSDWSDLINQSVYSTDGKRLGLLRKISSEYMVVSGGLINLSRYFIPKSIAQSVMCCSSFAFHVSIRGPWLIRSSGRIF
jgi:hypothetical protein